MRDAGAQPLPGAHLDWREHAPYAPAYGDIYFSHDAAQETERVFIAPSSLCDSPAPALFTVGELGFGTGLNFVATAAYVLRHTHARLHFISFEAHPLRPDDWPRVAAELGRGALAALFAELTRPPLALLGGWQRRVLAAGRVTLSVFHGDVAEGLADLQTRQQQPVDAWFLDGFAPDRNPDMWRPDLFTRIADMSRAQSSVTTFTAVGQVRRDLQSAGFTMRRVDQRPHKRESLAGRLMGKPARQPIIPPKRVSVVGGGIAAASTARHLAEQGIGVDLIAPTGLADGASQITSAVCHGRLLGDRSAAADLRAQAFLYSTAYLRQAVGFDGHGVLQVQGPTMDARKLGRISTAYDASNPAQGWVDACTPEQAYQRSGFRPQGDSLWFAQAGAIDLAATTRALVDHPGIEPLTRPTAQDQPEVWCTADAILQVSGCEHLEISTIHGQLDVYRHATNIRAPIVGNGYFVPGAGEITLGATYEYSPWSTARARAHNLDANRPYLNDADLGPAARSIKAARAVSSDRTPIIGPLGDLWLNLAHGSMGATTAPLGAAVIASRLLGWISPVNPAVETVLDPDRFARRQARRGRRHGR